MTAFLPKPTTPIADPDSGAINGQWLGVITQAANGIFAGIVALSTRGPTWTTGTVAPSSVQPVGSLYSRVGGAVGATIYISRGSGVWLPVAGV